MVLIQCPPFLFFVTHCALISSPCKGEDEGEGPITARDPARDSGFRVRSF